MDKQPVTINGLNKIKTELNDRKNNIRPKIVQAIAEARSHGDLKENAEYHAAKEEQGLNEKRIQELETTIATANVIDVTKLEKNNKVIFGSTIVVKDLDTEKKNKYKIVGKDEADVRTGLIYYQSPMGRGFIGKNKGEFVEIKTPSGDKNFEITDVQYI
ncbi:MAG: transcription elongation factor GreA [Pelagibacteraceae bacterium]|jgi:transcription elongation factor GreA|nr:transcription elongation factor GreA [Pelagibacteraceae bacterium]|tara:strand:- start:686 stop:1162 length:477 start_codon:yes stop_codon:yes gene_type:complete